MFTNFHPFILKKKKASLDHEENLIAVFCFFFICHFLIPTVVFNHLQSTQRTVAFLLVFLGFFFFGITKEDFILFAWCKPLLSFAHWPVCRPESSGWGYWLRCLGWWTCRRTAGCSCRGCWTELWMAAGGTNWGNRSIERTELTAIQIQPEQLKKRMKREKKKVLYSNKTSEGIIQHFRK